MSKAIKHDRALCLDKCQYRRTCANHVSAGDFRTEDGFSPILWYKEDPSDKSKKELICESTDYKSNNDPYRPIPEDCSEPCGGYVSEDEISNQTIMDQLKYLKEFGSENVKTHLKRLLNDCLENGNQANSFEITGISLEKGKLYVAFDIVAIPEDNYIGFKGY